MKGHIRQRGTRSFELKFDAGRDADGERIIEYRNFKGTKREAQVELAKLIAAVGKGEHVKRSGVTVAEHVEARIKAWEALGKTGPKTVERYCELLANQIVPHIGAACPTSRRCRTRCPASKPMNGTAYSCAARHAAGNRAHAQRGDQRSDRLAGRQGARQRQSSGYRHN